MMAVFSFINLNKDVYEENFSLALTELIASLHETSFISDPLTKEKVLDFTMQLIEGEFKHEVRQFQKPYDNQQAEQISLMV